jgi:hypothetical protein
MLEAKSLIVVSGGMTRAYERAAGCIPATAPRLALNPFPFAHFTIQVNYFRDAMDQTLRDFLPDKKNHLNRGKNARTGDNRANRGLKRQEWK